MRETQPGSSAVTEWLARLYRLADDVDLGLSSRATASEIRAVVNDMYAARQRAVTLADITGASQP